MQIAENTLIWPAITRLEHFPPASRLWFYIAARPLTEAEAEATKSALERFAAQWTAHDHALNAFAELFAQQAIILCVDETQADASGCSIDSSTRFLQQLSRQLNVDLFDRMIFGWLNEAGDVRFSHRDELVTKFRDGIIHPDTLMLNTLSPTLGELKSTWIRPLHQSWHQRIL